MYDAERDAIPPEIPDPPEEESARQPASEPPDPDDAPTPVDRDDPVLKAIGAVSVTLAALGGLLIPAFTTVRATAGATRSTQLEWERRQCQIERAVESEQITSPDDEVQP